jgi:general secretion pathway protein A
MYEQFYGLNENPFSVTPNPQYVYLGENHREALAQLLYGVREKKGFIVITGEVGTGKTTLLHYLLNKMSESNHARTAFLFNPKLTVRDFIQYILRDLGIDATRGTKTDYLQILHQYLLDAYQKNENVVLIVDEAQGLNPELLEEIRLLSNFETSTSKLLQIVLVGQPELNKTLMQPGFRQLKQRINMRYHLHPLSGPETKAYIEKRLRVAGARQPIFTEDALKEIYRKSRGVPRLINILCDNALLSGYALEKKLVNHDLIREAAEDLKLARKHSRLWLWVLLGVCVIGMVILAIEFNQSGPILDVFRKFLDGLGHVGDLAKEGIEYLSQLLRKGLYQF